MSPLVVSPALCIGMTLLAFSCSGNMPALRLRLKIWARGLSISARTDLSNFELVLGAAFANHSLNSPYFRQLNVIFIHQSSTNTL